MPKITKGFLMMKKTRSLRKYPFIKSAPLSALLVCGSLCLGCLLPAGSAYAAGSSAAGSSASEDVSKRVLVENASSYITLPDLDTLTANRTATLVTDDQVEQRMAGNLSLSDIYTETDQPISDGSYVTLSLTILDGSTVLEQLEDDFTLTIGEAFLGQEFDSELIGYSRGEDFAFTISYPDTFMDEEWAGKDISFEGTIANVETVTVPEITDEIVSDKTSYDSVDDYREAVRSKMQEEYDAAADVSLYAQLLSITALASSFEEYPEDLYEQCAAAVDRKYEQYGSLDASENEWLDSYRETETEELVRKYLVISALFEQEGLTLSSSECHDLLQAVSLDLDYDTLNDYLATMDTDTQIWTACERKAALWLEQHIEVLDNILDYSLEDLEIPEDIDEDAEDVIMGLPDGGVPVSDDEE